MTELRRFSHSLVDCWLDCPKKAFYRYVENIPSPSSPALIKGSAVDEAANYDLVHYIENGRHAPSSEVADVAASVADELSQDLDVDWQDETPELVKDSAIALAKTWRRELAPDIEATAVQVEYHQALPSGRDFIGFVDWEGTVDGLGPVLGDNKTGRRRFSRDEAYRHLQPYAYAFLRQEPTTFVFARAIDTGRSLSSEFAWTQRSVGDIAWYARLVADVERAFEEGFWPTNPKSNLCGPRWCPFYERCQPHRSTAIAQPLKGANAA